MKSKDTYFYLHHLRSSLSRIDRWCDGPEAASNIILFTTVVKIYAPIIGTHALLCDHVVIRAISYFLCRSLSNAFFHWLRIFSRITISDLLQRKRFESNCKRVIWKQRMVSNICTISSLFSMGLIFFPNQYNLGFEVSHIYSRKATILRGDINRERTDVVRLFRFRAHLFIYPFIIWDDNGKAGNVMEKKRCHASNFGTLKKPDSLKVNDGSKGVADADDTLPDDVEITLPDGTVIYN